MNSIINWQFAELQEKPLDDLGIKKHYVSACWYKRVYFYIKVLSATSFKSAIEHWHELWRLNSLVVPTLSNSLCRVLAVVCNHRRSCPFSWTKLEPLDFQFPVVSSFDQIYDTILVRINSCKFFRLTQLKNALTQFTGHWWLPLAGKVSTPSSKTKSFDIFARNANLT